MPFNHADQHRDEHMMMMQANIDDMNPEFCPYISDLLFKQGANDVYWVPIIMKKGRPGMMLNVLIDEEKLTDAEDTIFRETTTLGIRYWPVSCHRLGRQMKKTPTPWGPVDVKMGMYQGRMVQFAPEFQQCQDIATKQGIPLKQVYDIVRKNAHHLDGDDDGDARDPNA